MAGVKREEVVTKRGLLAPKCCVDEKVTSAKNVTPEKKTGPGKANSNGTEARKKDLKASKSVDSGCARSSKARKCSREDLRSSEEADYSKSLRLRKSAQLAREAEEKVKMMFTSSEDPYEKSLEWWEQPHVKYAFSYSPVRTRLELLMGSSVVRLTDRKYMLKLISRIREEHERKQQARIQERKTRELMRTKDMILSRFMSIQEAPSEICEYPLFQLYLYCDSIIERRRDRRIPRKATIPTSLYRLLYPQPSSENPIGGEEEEEHEDVHMKEVVVDGETILVPMTAEEIEHQAKQKETAEDIKNGYMFTKEEYESLHYEADAVKKLKDIKSVNEMYKKAHEIVGFLFSFAPNEKRKRPAMDEDPTELLTSSLSNVKSESASTATTTAASIKRHM